MPIYSYKCKNCEHQFEQRQRMSDAPLTECPVCQGQVRRVVNSVGVVFKGSGFYVTDNRNGSNLNGSSKSSSEKSDSKKSSKESTAAKTGEAKSSGKAKEKSATAKS